MAYAPLLSLRDGYDGREDASLLHKLEKAAGDILGRVCRSYGRICHVPGTGAVKAAWVEGDMDNFIAATADETRLPNEGIWVSSVHSVWEL